MMISLYIGLKHTERHLDFLKMSTMFINEYAKRNKYTINVIVPFGTGEASIWLKVFDVQMIISNKAIKQNNWSILMFSLMNGSKHFAQALYRYRRADKTELQKIWEHSIYNEKHVKYYIVDPTEVDVEEFSSSYTRYYYTELNDGRTYELNRCFLYKWLGKTPDRKIEKTYNGMFAISVHNEERKLQLKDFRKRYNKKHWVDLSDDKRVPYNEYVELLKQCKTQFIFKSYSSHTWSLQRVLETSMCNAVPVFTYNIYKSNFTHDLTTLEFFTTIKNMTMEKILENREELIDRLLQLPLFVELCNMKPYDEVVKFIN